MIVLYEKSLPNTINVEGKLIFLNTDFRLWVRFLAEIETAEDKAPDISYLFKDLKELPKGYAQMLRYGAIPETLFNAVIEFAKKDSIYPLAGGKSSAKNVITTDYIEDGPFIYAAFMKNYHIDLLKEDMHWYVFKALLSGLYSDYSNIVSNRMYDGKDTKLMEIRESWSVNRAKKIKKSKIEQTQIQKEIDAVYQKLYALNQASLKKNKK